MELIIDVTQNNFIKKYKKGFKNSFLKVKIRTNITINVNKKWKLRTIFFENFINMAPFLKHFNFKKYFL